jgi:ABC-type Fe3+-siderophore transport system permease subunit
VIPINLGDARHFRVFGADSMFGEALARLGIANAWTEATSYSAMAPVGLEALARVPEAWIVLIPPTRRMRCGFLSRSAFWNALPNVRAGPPADAGLDQSLWRPARRAPLRAVADAEALIGHVRMRQTGVASIVRDTAHRGRLGGAALLAGAALCGGGRNAPAAGRRPCRARVLEQILLWHSLVPRFVTALLCGAALGLSGALLQRVLRNPIADPSTLGIASGAQLALTVATAYAPALIAFSREAWPLAAASRRSPSCWR